MKRLVAAIVLLCGIALAATPAAAPEYFKFSRTLSVANPARQTYFVVDQTMWDNMRTDLGDMRLYAGSTEIPYALRVQRGGSHVQQTPAKLYDLGETSGKTTFKLESPVTEYDTITLDLKTRNFVTQASVEGSDDGTSWSALTTATVFDFTDEKLGANTAIRLRTPSRFKHLRVTIADRVPAKEVLAASIAFEKVHEPSWVKMVAQPNIKQSGRDTIIEWDSPQKVPLGRLELNIGDPALNFSRSIALEDSEGRVIATSELARVHLTRFGRSIDREELGLTLFEDARSKHYKLTIHNGDDRPLPVISIEPLSCERRVYFDPQVSGEMSLYFGDEKVEPPAYDFARFFEADPNAVRADLSEAHVNPAYNARPDDRPWSERNKWVLWTVLILAVLGLGALAVRSMTKVAQ